jgi:N-acetylmuramoyl-L-alanine amidase
VGDPENVGLPLGVGAQGEAVRDVQRRLAALGYGVDDVAGGTYGPMTEVAVRAFQESRRLRVDGICGPDTWHALVEAGYRLGDRFLYHRTPMQRGDDVSELQSSLGALGFDAGRVDGICGPDTARALQEFQRNSGLTADGICGPDTVSALRRLAGRRAGPTSVAQAREVMALRDAPRQLGDRRIVLGVPGTLDALAGRVQQLLSDAGAAVTVLHPVDGSVQAREANELDAELYVGLRLVPEPLCRVAFYATEGFESVGGRRLAELSAKELGTILDLEGEPLGMRLPVLRETRMPAVLCTLGPVDKVVIKAADLATSLATSITEWVEHRLDT